MVKTTKLLVAIMITAFTILPYIQTARAIEEYYQVLISGQDPQASSIEAAANKLNDMNGVDVQIIKSSSITNSKFTDLATGKDVGESSSSIADRINKTTNNLTSASNPAPPIQPDPYTSDSPSDLLGKDPLDPWPVPGNSPSNNSLPDSAYNSSGSGGKDSMGFEQGYQTAKGIDTALNQNLTSKQIIKNTINVVLTLIGVVTAGILVLGGMLYITSAGEEEKAKKGKTLVTYAVIGLLIIGMSAIIINVIINTIFKRA